MVRKTPLFLTVLLVLWGFYPSMGQEKPNILVIMGDDIGWFNTSAYNDGMMGYTTPNIDRIANEGMRFTDAYGQQSCTAGRAAFITGQSPKRTGLLKIGMPGDPMGLQPEDPTIAELLKPHGYATGQFGKNHLGDLDEFLPTNHGFDRFFGNLYHLNAEEEPENPDYPKSADFRENYGPRGVLKSSADGPVQDTGPLTKERMETIDQEFLDATMDFIEEQHDADKPFFAWFNTTRMHIFTHLPEEYDGKTGLGIMADGMTQHDYQIGILLDKLDELGITDNTIVIYTTDNGAEKFSWPDGGTSPFKGEKATTWEGGIRVPFMIRWPEKIAAGKVSNEIISLEDCLPTLLAAAGDSDIKSKLLNGHSAAGKTFKVHIDGYNFLPYLTGDAEEGPRNEFFAFVDDGSLGAVRYGRWKFHFSTQDHEGLGAWIYPQTVLKAPLLVDLYADPFELAMDNSAYYDDWVVRRMFAFEPLKNIVGSFMATFKDFPPRQESGSFTPRQ
ncbi:arylsulfatase [Echinicola vietnamensis]|uniref:Arylsulfatase A family protein n=1 Tax=Echinicola vietnamensis (strain DSM 17526 / LMG 23754 / KMM 6221) TaxID=926556 RepID=L0G636_ECHVK|nr:arylsulfatase [Echinicola vietnamensis]AGA80763.1 arylsulfatase A family protein [Echinicola vietnamensis DSM 17526]